MYEKSVVIEIKISIKLQIPLIVIIILLPMLGGSDQRFHFIHPIHKHSELSFSAGYLS